VNNLASRWDNWFGFEAGHVFPLQQESLWIQHNYARWITNTDNSRGSAINSIQNGLLMSGTYHSMFDQYIFSINPDVSIPELILAILT
jgi:hypothetical protein